MNNVTLLVDGSVLKKHVAELGQTHTPQLVMQYLSHMVQAIRQEEPAAHVLLQYYGAKFSEPIKTPISGQPYVDPELKFALRHCRIPGATLQCAWGKVPYPSDPTWILKSGSYHKDNLTDADFVLNEKPKGVLAQLVSKMADCAVSSPQMPMYVYGDIDDMAYAVHTSQWLGAKVRQISLNGKRPCVSEIPQDKELHLFDKKQILQMGQDMTIQPDQAAYLKTLRASCAEQDKKAILMLDMGIIRKYLEQRGCRMNVPNVQLLLNQIEDSLPMSPAKTILYCSFSNDKKLVSPFPDAPAAFVESAGEKQLLGMPNVEVSAGKTVQDKLYPSLLKKSKWHTSAAERDHTSFEYNVHQADVDDRIVYDMNLYGFDPNVSQLYVLATDGDFAYPVEKVAQLGLPTALIYLDFGTKDLSYRLQKGADTVIPVLPNVDSLTSRNQEEKNKRLKRQANSDAKRKQLQKMQRRWARDEENEYDEPGQTKEDRWGAACGANRREIRNQLQHRR